MTQINQKITNMSKTSNSLHKDALTILFWFGLIVDIWLVLFQKHL